MVKGQWGQIVKVKPPGISRIIASDEPPGPAAKRLAAAIRTVMEALKPGTNLKTKNILNCSDYQIHPWRLQ